MRPIVLAMLLLPLLSGTGSAITPGCPAAPPQPLHLPALKAAVLEARPVTVVAFGSSSTQGSGASTPAAAYPARLEAELRTSLPGAEVRVVNRGIGGQDAEEMLVRLDAEVVAERPAVVIWQLGANAALRRGDPVAFLRMVRDGLVRLRAAGIEVVLMDNQRAPAIAAMPEAPAFDAALAALAEQPGVALFSRGQLMRAWTLAGTAPDTMIGKDGLHHTDRGYACLAGALADGILLGMTWNWL